MIIRGGARAGAFVFKPPEMFGLMPYRIEIPTDCIRRVSYPPRSQSPVYGQTTMMLQAGRDRCLQSGRLMNMEGPGWPNQGARGIEDENRTETPRRPWPYRNEPRYPAAAFASPTFSQIHRESLFSPQQTAHFRSPTRPHPVAEGEEKRAYDDGQHLEHHDPYLRLAGPSFEEPQSWLDFTSNEHPLDHHLEVEHGPGFFVDESLPPEAAPPLHEAQYEVLPSEALAPEDPSGRPRAGRIHMHIPGKPRKSVPRRNSERGRSARRGSLSLSAAARQRFHHRGPSSAEIESCSTNRAREALNVWYQRYNELVDYRSEHGDCNVPQKYEPNTALGIW